MSNYLTVDKREQIQALLALRWSDRRIAREVGVNRETVGRRRAAIASKPAEAFPGSGDGDGTAADRGGRTGAAKPAEVFAGSGGKPAKAFAGSRSSAEAYRDEVRQKLAAGLTAQRIWQDLVEEHGYGGSYESVKRFVRRAAPERRATTVMHSPPGEEAQVDFFQGPPTLDGEAGQWRRPWVFRMTLCCSRHGYEEAVWDQKLETFLRLHERAFAALGGIPKVVRHDNLKAAVVRACLYDPDANPVYAAFAAHWGFAALPIRPRHPQENGKEERAGGYVKDNALKGRRFDGLAELNAFLRRWNETIARLRIHGTTRKQVWRHYLETDKDALQPLGAAPFSFFRRGTRVVHADGHVEVEAGFYPVPTHLLGRAVEVLWDGRLVRVRHEGRLVAVHARVEPGRYAAAPGAPAASLVSTQRVFLERQLARCGQVGPDLRAWAEAAFAARGVRAMRLIQGTLGLLRRFPREEVLAVARLAAEHGVFRYRIFARLVERRAVQRTLPALLAEHELIRPMSAYALEDLT
ncbi:MAG: IS21 family transposase [Candidatus Polarisedimenticolia bacterium]